MKICVTSTGPTLDSTVDMRFGRCSHFIFVDSDTMEFEAIANPNSDATGGAGILSAQLVVNQGAGAVVTGRVGPNAEKALRSTQLEVLPVEGGTVRDAVETFRERHAGATSPRPMPEDSTGQGLGLGRRWRRGRGLGSKGKV